MPDEVTAAVKKAMTDLEIPARKQGSAKRGLVYEPHKFPDEDWGVGRNNKKGISVDAGILRNWKVAWSEWNAADLATRIEAVIQHEWFEFKGASHNEAVAMGRRGEFTLKISESARKLLRTMPFEP
jgi:hypothetical protein